MAFRRREGKLTLIETKSGRGNVSLTDTYTLGGEQLKRDATKDVSDLPIGGCERLRVQTKGQLTLPPWW